MRNSSKSFAHQYGITQKNVINNPSSGIGLNPNLNIEDEYIQNLLKQTHFLNMEIKLMKQKQKENKGMGIMGLLNKDQNPVVKHAITSNDKYSEMKNKLGSMVNIAQVQYLKLDDQNFAVKAERDFVEFASLKQQQKNIKNKNYVDERLLQLNNKFKQNQKRLIEMRQQSSRVKANYQRILREWQQITTKQATKKLFKQINNNLQNQFQQIKKRHFEIKNQILNKNQKILKEDDQKNRTDPNYIELFQENQQLLEKLKQSEKQLFDKNYRVKEMEELKKLSIRNKDYEAQAKKQAVQQNQKLKKKLTDRKTEFEAKLKESRNGLETNDQIRLLKGKVARKDKQIADIRKKTQISQKNFKTLRDQVEKLTKKRDQLLQINIFNQTKFKELVVKNNQAAHLLNTDQLDNEKLEVELKNTLSTLVQTRARLQKLEEQSTYLKAKQQFLKKQIDVEQGMKNIKIEDLTNLMHNNSGLNNTIKDLMEKWEQIRKFSRESPFA